MKNRSKLCAASDRSGPGLRQEQAKWNRLVPILISLSAQLPRLTSIRAKIADSQEVRLYLDSFHQDFGSWMEALGRFFSDNLANGE
jgi:hypothetical protein